MFGVHLKPLQQNLWWQGPGNYRDQSGLTTIWWEVEVLKPVICAEKENSLFPCEKIKRK